MGDKNIIHWINETVMRLRQHTSRTIMLRPHPGDKTLKLSNANISHLPNVVLSNPASSLVDDLQNCWAVVNHNSSPAVGAAIEGYPVFVTDPDRSQCREIANTNFADIENPVLYDRDNWIQRVSMFHWSFADVTSGKCWAHMRSHLLGT